MNMTKKKIYPFLIIAIALFLFLATRAAQNVNAEELPNTSNAVIEFEAGALSIPSAPGFSFKKGAIAAQSQAYTLEDEMLTPLAIYDLTGSNAGWEVTVALSTFKDTNNAPTLTGAVLTLNPNTVSPLNNTIATAPELAEAETFALTAGGDAINLLVAESENGGGAWALDFTNAGTTLTVFPGTATAAESSAILTWSIVTGP